MQATVEKTKSLTQQAFEQLRDLIVSNELTAGSTHLEMELAERLNMSRTPVREACLLLEAQGLVEVRARKGVRILALSPEGMREIYEVLTELESLSAELAAAKNLPEEDLAGLAVSIEKMEAALTDDDRVAWAKADEDFHSELVRLGGNSRIQGVVSTFNDQVRRARSITLYMRPLPTKSNEDHRSLYEAIRAGDAKKARKLHQDHRVKARELLTGLLSKHGLRSV